MLKRLRWLLFAMPALAQAEYPERMTRIVSPFSPGGGLDIVARLLAPKLSEAFKQPVTVENRTGANGQIANDFVAKSAPDGYTLLIDAVGFTVHPAVTKNLPYDPATMEPVAQLLSLPFVVVVNPKVPAKSVTELVDLARRNPGKLNFAQGGLTNLLHAVRSRIAGGAHRSAISGTTQYSNARNAQCRAEIARQRSLTVHDRLVDRRRSRWPASDLAL